MLSGKPRSEEHGREPRAACACYHQKPFLLVGTADIAGGYSRDHTTLLVGPLIASLLALSYLKHTREEWNEQPRYTTTRIPAACHKDERMLA